MNKVIEFLNNAARHYYNGEPIISDEQFDALAESVGYDKVGAKQHEHIEKHLYRMYSLQKFYDDEGKKSPLEGEKDVCISPKLDGAAVEHLYVDGQYMRTLTRGDGIEGTNVTDKFLATNLIPKTISIPGIVQISGEICAPKTTENARNYAAGALNLGSAEEFKTRAVEFFAYGITPSIGAWYDVDMVLLRKEGFGTVQDKNLAEIYPTDGLVFRVNSNARFEELGYTSKHPRGAYARKERQEAKPTTLLEVDWGVAKTGRVTPVAIFEPIDFDGKIVTRATLNNPGFIKALDLRIGDTILVRMAGMIIPEVITKIE